MIAAIYTLAAVMALCCMVAAAFALRDEERRRVEAKLSNPPYVPGNWTPRYNDRGQIYMLIAPADPIENEERPT